ncbi:cinnamycin family lantibiotic [Streptomonospora sp. S1-112]|uniref:Cinnamycin family lantibiotic n=1 Tax=Streptomonospora mangrovi TaxID=2883123 RepID=A0A9X3NRC8_9ACTN|nr:cinnamycin family lantibiotic [Streptomonospora mangrovi]MDA0566911.1 cinnamycin family lantibiotic [Streptomonospora mangrovi]
MSTTTLMHQAAVDAEFRAAVLADPAAFGLTADALPTAVEQADQAAVDSWTDGIVSSEIFACSTSCSWGPFTVVCDGSTK